MKQCNTFSINYICYIFTLKNLNWIAVFYNKEKRTLLKTPLLKCKSTELEVFYLFKNIVLKMTCSNFAKRLIPVTRDVICLQKCTFYFCPFSTTHSQLFEDHTVWVDSKLMKL